MYKKHVLICEKGWRRIRELSLDLESKNIHSTVLIKGLVDKDVREMITRHDGVSNVFISGKFFTPFLFIYIIVTLILSKGGELVIFLSKEKTYGRLSVFKKIFPSIDLIKVFE
ncbi:hypothetical protein ACFL0P_06975 [Candidatus Omnitrophota bacterium]